MPTVYCYPVKLTIADLIRAKSIKHMLTDSVQPYNKPIIDLACSDCTVKYQTSVFSILKNLGLIFHSTDRTSEVNKPLLRFHHI
jgi:hypothetical protein